MVVNTKEEERINNDGRVSYLSGLVPRYILILTSETHFMKEKGVIC
jgi:hypothetical protein